MNYFNSSNTPNGAAATATTTTQAQMQSSESSQSYFPHEPSPRSSISSEAATPTAAATTATTASPSPVTHHNMVSPLDRHYAKPTEELDVAKQLAKEPLYWSAHGWARRNASSNKVPKMDDDETRARKLAEAKRELLALAGRL